MLDIYTDEYFMRKALEEAEVASELGEVPVGAIIVCQNRIIARAHNQVESLNDITAHAEILAITAASNYLGSKFLEDCEMFVSLEPCPMCAGAIRWSRISRLVYAASDDKAGFMRFGKSMLHPKTRLEFGIMHDRSIELMQSFFAARRLS